MNPRENCPERRRTFPGDGEDVAHIHFWNIRRYIFTRTCISTYTYTYIFTCACIPTYTHTNTHRHRHRHTHYVYVCMYVCIHTHTYTHKYTHTHTHIKQTHTHNTQAYMHLGGSVRLSRHAYVYVCGVCMWYMYVCMYVCMYLCIYANKIHCMHAYT